MCVCIVYKCRPNSVVVRICIGGGGSVLAQLVSIKGKEEEDRAERGGEAET